MWTKAIVCTGRTEEVAWRLVFHFKSGVKCLQVARGMFISLHTFLFRLPSFSLSSPLFFLLQTFSLCLLFLSSPITVFPRFRPLVFPASPSQLLSSPYLSASLIVLTFPLLLPQHFPAAILLLRPHIYSSLPRPSPFPHLSLTGDYFLNNRNKGR